MGDSALTNFAEQIMANRRANMIAEAIGNAEYWKAQCQNAIDLLSKEYNELYDRYDNLVKKYNHDTAQRDAEKECLFKIIHDNIDNLNISKEAIFIKLDIARNKAAEAYPPVD